MIFGNSESEQHRIKLGILFLALGVVLMLWAWGSWVYRASQPAEGEQPVAASPAPEEGGARPVEAARRASLFLLAGFLMVLAFLVGSYLLVRSGRRLRERLAVEPAAPTTAEDVWAMHKRKSYEDEP